MVSGTHRTHGDELVAVVHHRDQEVEQHDDVDQREASKHDQPPEPKYCSMIMIFMMTYDLNQSKQEFEECGLITHLKSNNAHKGREKSFNISNIITQ